MPYITYTKYEGADAIQRANAQRNCAWKWWRYDRSQGNLALIAYLREEGELIGKAFLLLRDCSYIRFDHEMDHARFEMGGPADLGLTLALPLPECAHESACLIVMRNETNEYCVTCSGCTLYAGDDSGEQASAGNHEE